MMNIDERMQKEARKLMESNQALLDAMGNQEGKITKRLFPCFVLTVYGLFTAWLASMAWGYGHDANALDRPLAQVTLNELVSDGCRGLLGGILAGLLGIAALALLWRGLRKLWCDQPELDAWYPMERKS